MNSGFKDPTSEDFDQMPLTDQERKEINRFFIRIAVIAWLIVIVSVIIYLN